MAVGEHQQSFVEQNGDQVGEHVLDQVDDKERCQVQNPTLEQPQYQVHDQSQDQQQYQVLDNLECQQQEQDQSKEEEQVQAHDQLQYQSQDQEQYQFNDQEQDQAGYQPQDQEQYQFNDQEKDQAGYQPQDQEQYQFNDEEQHQAGYKEKDQAQVQEEDHVPDHGQDLEVVPEDTEPLPNSEHEQDGAVGDEEKRWPGWPGESVFRMLVPAQKVGSIIGRKGDLIKKIVEETRARIKILDGPPGTSERAVMVSAKEEPDAAIPPAIDGLLRVHMRIVDGLDGDSSHIPPSSKVSTRLLVPASQAGNLIGKQGGTVKSIQEASSCVVRVLGTEDLPIFALQDDRVVEVGGDPSNVHKALELVASHLRKFLVDRSIITLFETQMQKPNRKMDHMSPHQRWGPPQGLPPNAGGAPGYGHNPSLHRPPPPRQVENFYPLEMRPSPMEKQPHQGISAYGREPPVAVHSSSAPSMQVTQQLQIPLSFADAVIGTSGSSISYIRRASGATVTIQESRGAPGEMTVEISGSASQVQTAQQLVQNFMAEAGGPAPTQTTVSAEQAYNQYAAHGSVYTSTASNPGHASHPGGYGTDYGSGYGY